MAITFKTDQAVTRDEHNEAALAKKSLMIGFDGTDYKVVVVDSDGSLQVMQRAVVDTPVTAEDILFETGDSPFTFDINTALGRNSTQFSVTNDGPGDFNVSISNDGIAFGNEHRMKNEEVYEIQNISVDSIRITFIIANSAYRIVAL